MWHDAFGCESLNHVVFVCCRNAVYHARAFTSLAVTVGYNDAHLVLSGLLYLPNGNFKYGLLVDNPGGKEKAAWAKFGDNTARSHMTLHAGHYSLKSRVCNWNRPEYSPVTYTIETPDGQEVASKIFTINKNIGGNTDNTFSTGKGQTFEFDIPETGDYVFSVYTDAEKNADFVLGMATLQAKSFSETGIQEILPDNSPSYKSGCFDLSGRRIAESDTANGQLKPGLYIIDGRKVVIR